MFTLDKSTRLLLIVATPIILAVSGFVGYITLSMLPFAPKGELVDLSQRLQSARMSAFSVEEARDLELAAAKLEAARRMIVHEDNRPLTLRSYDRVHDLLWKAEQLLDGAGASRPTAEPPQAVPAGS